jgi:hypothetical protein
MTPDEAVNALKSLGAGHDPQPRGERRSLSVRRDPLPVRPVAFTDGRYRLLPLRSTLLLILIIFVMLGVAIAVADPTAGDHPSPDVDVRDRLVLETAAVRPQVQPAPPTTIPETWLKRASAGDPIAQYALGRLLLQRQGRPADSAAAIVWLEKAAGQGNAEAAYDLASAYAAGNGVIRNDLQAVRWFSMAANAGLTAAQFNLAVLHEQGRGVPADPDVALRWYRAAAAGGDDEAAIRVSRLEATVK